MPARASSAVNPVTFFRSARVTPSFARAWSLFQTAPAAFPILSALRVLAASAESVVAVVVPALFASVFVVDALFASGIFGFSCVPVDGDVIDLRRDVL